jgi:acetyltransferase
MRRILEYAERKGIGEIWGDVLTENHAMLRMCRELGFEVPSESRDPQIRRVRKRLRPGA